MTCDKEFVLGVDIGGTHLRLGMVTSDKKLSNFVIEDTSKLYSEYPPIENLMEIIENYLGNSRDLKAISIGFPSVVSKDKKIVFSSPNLLGFNNVNVVAPFESRFQVPIYIDNDVNFLLYHEIESQQLTKSGIVVGFYIGTGFGNSIFINDRFLRGKHGAAAELGHIPVLDRSETCSCGNSGCIELYSSGKRLQEIRTEHFPEEKIQDLFVKHKSSPVIQDYIRAMSIPIATEINILDPDHVIIGGGVVMMEGFPKQELEKYIYLNTRKPYPANGLQISYAQANQTIGVLGAAYYAWRELKQHASVI